MRAFIFPLTSVITILVVVFVMGIYPVVVMDGDMIMYRTFAKAERAAENFANTEFKKTGMKPIDFELDVNASIRRDIKRGTMTFLIEDRILQREGGNIRDEFAALVKMRVDEALAKSNNIGRATRKVYGFTLEDFRVYVLMPQARRDIMAEILKEEKKDFALWMEERRRAASVRFYFVDFTWTGDRVL